MDRDGVVDQTIAFGQPGDIPMVGDWDGDGKWDVALVRRDSHPNSACKWLLRSVDRETTIDRVFGLSQDKFVAADWNGDGKTDLGAVRFENGKATFFMDLNADPWPECLAQMELVVGETAIQSEVIPVVFMSPPLD
jgi:hypothetical protein